MSCSNITSSFLKEQKRYSFEQLCSLINCSHDKTVNVIRKLKEYGVLKTVKSTDLQRDLSDLSDDDTVIADIDKNENDYLYVLTFVGVIVVSGCVLKCYPKYLPDMSNPKKELKQILKVLEKYSAKEQIIRMFNENKENGSFNHLAVMLFLIQDYFENGLYTNSENIIENNGSGEILWNKTINETFTLISHNRPFYPDLLTQKRVNNDFDYFKRLHECILTRISKELKMSDLLDLFDITDVELSEEELDEFGDKEYILYRIEKELNIQYNTRKQLVLKTIYSYLDLSGNLYDSNCVSLFGTNSFNLVWEKVCSEILDNQLEKTLDSLLLPKPISKENTKAGLKLIDLIEKPKWSYPNKEAEDTLIPDLIAVSQDSFIIFDAKYYTPTFIYGKTPKGQPGIESITKQYLYQLAYMDFIEEQKFKNVRNCFLMPTCNEKIENKGRVSMTMFSKLKLQDIEVRYLPAAKAFGYYLSGKKMKVEELNLY